ncbi:DUF6300 family protein [Streptomyces werraensis]|uniref:DUF6300 family protein n=1 Tax=Streptomyces werraensis TaxID=68284 RepID=UPI0034326009
MTTEHFHVKVDHLPDCGRCGARTFLMARYPHSWDNRAGEAVNGYRETALCPICHYDQPEAHELLIRLQNSPDAGAEVIASCAGLVAAWIEAERQRQVDPVALERELAAWHAGEL